MHSKINFIKMKKFIIILSIIFLADFSYAQMIDGQDIKYGNEWINFGQEYYKIPVSEDGIYRITYSQMNAAGIKLSQVRGDHFRLYAYGKEIPIFISTESYFSSSDYIEFYGEKNRSKLDSFLYRLKANIFNPEYSLFNDTMAYFLTWNNEITSQRYTVVNTDLTGNTLTPIQYYIHEEKAVFSSDFNKPLHDAANHVLISNFDTGEGFGSKLDTVNTFDMTTSDYVSGVALPTISFRYATNKNDHSISFYVNGKFKKNIGGNGFLCNNADITLTDGDIKNNMQYLIRGINNGNIYDRVAISTITLKYPREFKFNNASYFPFKAEKTSFTEYYELQNFNLNGSNFAVYDVTHNKIIKPQIDLTNKLVKFILNPLDQETRLVMVNLDKSAKTVESIKKISFVDFSTTTDKNYIIITDRDKFYNANQVNMIDEYSNYRQSQTGGSFKTLIVNIQNVYDQFCYGIDRHNLALNNFVMYCKDHFLNPEYIFIMGKGLEYNEFRTSEQVAQNSGYFIVPTFGYPGADNLIAARLYKDYPEIAIGRIAVKNADQLEIYLNKVKRYELSKITNQTIDDKLWMKKVIHLIGGDTPTLIGQIKTWLANDAAKISNSKFGAYVHTYERTSSTAQESVTKQISDDINSGAAWVTFFGHSGVTGSDFNISNLSNNRYPVFYSLGCYSGNIHTTINGGQSEDFVINDGYMIVFAGTTGSGFTNVLALLANYIYTNTGEDMYGSSVGKILRKSIESNYVADNDAFMSLNQQFTYHGDPAISLFSHQGPDYLVDYKSVKVEPGVISSSLENFKFSFDVINIGSSVKDSLIIRVLRKLPGGKVDTLEQKFLSPKAIENYNFTINTKGSDGVGENCISVYLNPKNTIAEVPTPEALNNNEMRDQNGENKYCFYIVDNGVRVLYPEQFSIVNKPEVELQASTLNFFMNEQKFIIEFDTTELYNSPFKKTTQIYSKGGLIKWKPPVSLTHNTVYYWRISPDSLNAQVTYNWSNSSFVYLQNSSEGWNQSHYFQFLKDEPQNIFLHNNRSFKFNYNTHSIRIKGVKYIPGNVGVAFFNGLGWATLNPVDYKPCITIFGLGPLGFSKFPNMTFGEVGNGDGYAYYFKTETSEQRKGIKNLLDNMPDSTTVFVYTYLDQTGYGLFPELWANDSISLGYNLFNALESYGAQKIRLMQTKGTVPYVFVFKKGSGVLFEQIGKNFNDEFETEIPVHVFKTSGSFESTLIGPASKWDNCLWKESLKNDNDISNIMVYKFDKELNLASQVDTLNSIYEFDLSSIDPIKYPYLKLQLNSQDGVQRSPVNIDFWRILYQGFPDAVLINDENAYFYKDTLENGDAFKFKSIVYNNTSIDMDSLSVRFKIKKQNNQEIIVDKKYKPLLAGTSYELLFDYPSISIPGVNEFSVEVNYNKEQKEKYYFNNYGVKRFFVRQDDKNPVMDVTFDGVHIMDGDIISPKPLIKVMVVDDNKYQLLNNKSIFQKLTLLYPSGKTAMVDLNDNSIVEFIPAQSFDNNKAILNFKPLLNEEGLYQLVAQCSDIAGNLAGQNEYKISFKVILKEQISEVYNYPNPFSTKTQFVFTLTGQDLPKDINIKIMTMSGKVVRELNSIDLGTFKYGLNRTEGYWDGTDEYGKKLANGIYLYEVTAVDSTGKKYENLKLDQNSDKFFKNGLGKLVILR